MDRPDRIVDFLVRFHPHSRVFNPRHLAETRLLVVQGEHCLYELDGPMKEIRSVGSYTCSAPGGVHTEGAADEDCIVLHNIRGNGGAEMFDALDAEGETVARIGLDDFAALLEAQRAA